MAQRNKKTSRDESPATSHTHIGGDVNCATYINRDQKNYYYGFRYEEVERLISLVLDKLNEGGRFRTIREGIDEKLVMELGGEKLIFPSTYLKRLEQGADERRYLLSLVVKPMYQAWASGFIPLAAQSDVLPQPLDIPIPFSEVILPPPGSGTEAQIRSERLQDITQALVKHSVFIILGEPGGGKTTTLLKIAYEQARERLSGRQGRIPLYVRLSQQKERLPEDFLSQEWQRQAGGSLREALAHGRMLLLADGVNELPRQGRSEILKDWRLFIQDHGDANQLVFTSRSRDYDILLDVPRVVIESLDDERIEDYLDCTKAQDLKKWLDDPRKRLRRLARNPFYLSLMVRAYLTPGSVIGNQGRLLQWFSQCLFHREENMAHPGWIDIRLQTIALQRLAFAMQEKREESTVFSPASAMEALPSVIDLDGEEVAIHHKNLLKFARAATILDAALYPDVRFYHQLLQEYFAALDLLRRFEAGQDLQRLWQAPRLAVEMQPPNVGEWDALPEPEGSGWEVTTILACGLLQDPTNFIEAVHSTNPILAGRCLDEAGLELPSEELLQLAREHVFQEMRNPQVDLRVRLQAGLLLGHIGDPRFKPLERNCVRYIPPIMVDIPAGECIIGSDEDDDEAYDDERPAQRIRLEAFSIGKYPVTNAEFACFIEAGGYRDERWWQGKLALDWLHGEDVTGGNFARWMEFWQKLHEDGNLLERIISSGNCLPDEVAFYDHLSQISREEYRRELSERMARKSRSHPQYWYDDRLNNPSQPVVDVTWFEACAYCVWLSHISGGQFCLPSEVQWEAAARGKMGLRYPWGNEWQPGCANTLESRILYTSPVGVFPGGMGSFGVEDQAGNVWEWTESLYLPYPFTKELSEVQALNQEEYVHRGGSWYNNHRYARCASCGWDVSDLFDNYVGFRIISPGSVAR